MARNRLNNPFEGDELPGFLGTELEFLKGYGLKGLNPSDKYDDKKKKRVPIPISLIKS